MCDSPAAPCVAFGHHTGLENDLREIRQGEMKGRERGRPSQGEERRGEQERRDRESRVDLSRVQSLRLSRASHEWTH